MQKKVFLFKISYFKFIQADEPLDLLQKQVDKTKDVVVNNINRISERDHQIEKLEEETNALVMMVNSLK